MKENRILQLLTQTENWVDGSGKTWRISDMNPSHRENVYSFLLRIAPGLASQAYDQLAAGLAPQGEMARDAHDATTDELADAVIEPLAWIAQQPLITALRESLNGPAAPEETCRAVLTLRLEVPLWETESTVQRHIERQLKGLRYPYEVGRLAREK